MVKEFYQHKETKEIYQVTTVELNASFYICRDIITNQTHLMLEESNYIEISEEEALLYKLLKGENNI